MRHDLALTRLEAICARITDVEVLRRLLSHDPITGALTWLPRPREMFSTDRHHQSWNTRWGHKPAFTAIDRYGYPHGSIFGRQYRAHRVVWALEHGEWPTGEIDHINHNRSDNSVANLRDVSHRENLLNQRLRKNNTSGVSGVSWSAHMAKWRSHVVVMNKSHHVGYFDSFDDAVAARDEAIKRYGFSEQHGRAA